MKLFKKRAYIPIQEQNKNQDNHNAKPLVPDGKWIKCPSCLKTIYQDDLGRLKLCPNCGHHFRLNANDRLELIMDTYTELFTNLPLKFPQDFPGYADKLDMSKRRTGLDEAVKVVDGMIQGNRVIVAVMDSSFMMGSMGQIVGEKITRAVEFALDEQLPLIIFTASGGARMQEGIYSLMQMAKISAALEQYSKAGLFYLTVLTDPTTGGVTASFAMLGDVILAEPNALVGFAGKRVIEQTINQQLPDDFQSAESVLKQGFIDKIVNRSVLKQTIENLLLMHHSYSKGGDGV
ncbi:acetyl-CoA carboxylase, carboxyltransferase subunit beta [Granulicatella seriolae]|uniref:Acetyl-coenzyme A carboxylase carboxyl transferase subunit beta n=1 Tax=Granulicatella seriolae TaxID=2967226 RepID=A0ABT1WL56_9LACT|nr:acetyl-CoA carboxylase, carboxyltransferase subunit beta [Granulicatella seriolae]